MDIFENVSLNPEEKAKRGLPIPNPLSIYDISELWGEITRDREIYREAMYSSYKDGSLKATELLEDIPGENEYFQDMPFLDVNQIYKEVDVLSSNFLIWLESKNHPKPTGCLLANWWKEAEAKTEAVGDAGIDKLSATKTKPLNQNSNNLDFSGLLNNPSKKDDWFRVIDDMTRGFYGKFGRLPNEPQAWGALWTSPPEGYNITTGKERTDEWLIMPGTAPLKRRSFNERWKKYTAPIQDKDF